MQTKRRKQGEAKSRQTEKKDLKSNEQTTADREVIDI